MWWCEKTCYASRSSSKCQYQWSWDKPYCPGCKQWCLMLQFGWEQALLKMCISKHCHKVTGFLLWIGTYCISCVVQQRSRVKDLFSLVGYDDSCLAEIRHVKSIIRVVQPRPHIRSHSVLFSLWSWHCVHRSFLNPGTLPHRATRDALCPLPNGVKFSLWRKLSATVDYATSNCPEIHIARRKLWWKNFTESSALRAVLPKSETPEA